MSGALKITTLAAMLLSVGMLSGCEVQVADNQPTQQCEALDGSDTFVLEPNDANTRIRRTGLSSFIIQFEDKATGYTRTMTDADFTRYRCRPVKP